MIRNDGIRQHKEASSPTTPLQQGPSNAAKMNYYSSLRWINSAKLSFSIFLPYKRPKDRGVLTTDDP
jgi:hypothetical protein